MRIQAVAKLGFAWALLALTPSAEGQTLVHLWAFDQPFGLTQTFPDSSGNGHTGVGAGEIVPGRFGNAVMLLPGSNPLTGGIGDGVDWVDPTPENTALPVGRTDSWTINVWTSFVSPPGSLEYIAGFGIDDQETSGNSFKARSIMAFPNFHFWGATVDLDAGFPYPSDGSWHMSTATYNGATTELTMYYDGIRVASRVFGGTGPFLDAPAEVHAGNPSNWNEEFDGTIDEFGIWNGALSPAQIGGLFLHNNIAQPQNLQPTAAVNRATGHITLSNLTLASINDFVGYQITSAAGALDAGPWVKITGNLDQGMGATPIDSGPWSVTSSTDFQLSEGDQGAPAGTFHLGQTIDFGAIWKKSSIEDVVVKLFTNDGVTAKTLDVLVSYTGTPYSRSDLDTNGVLDLNDWQIFSANGFTSLTGLSRVNAALRGDLDGDGDNDRLDFRQFRADYIAAHGEAAFAALLAAVPEPSTAVGMAILGVVALGFYRKR
ncbi:MAG: LamG domain-containing protein [Pirellulales bacterium]|nr:LamG domain-containing protein [Pirellulales bacterium]